MSVNIKEFYGPPSLKYVVFNDPACGSIWIRKATSVAIYDCCVVCSHRVCGTAIFTEEKEAVAFANRCHLAAKLVKVEVVKMSVVAAIRDKFADSSIKPLTSIFQQWLGWNVHWPCAESHGENWWTTKINVTDFNWGADVEEPQKSETVVPAVPKVANKKRNKAWV